MNKTRVSALILLLATISLGGYWYYDQNIREDPIREGYRFLEDQSFPGFTQPEGQLCAGGMKLRTIQKNVFWFSLYHLHNEYGDLGIQWFIHVMETKDPVYQLDGNDLFPGVWTHLRPIHDGYSNGIYHTELVKPDRIFYKYDIRIAALEDIQVCKDIQGNKYWIQSPEHIPGPNPIFLQDREAHSQNPNDLELWLKSPGSKEKA